jgi:drug/metabolite transporter (DMT)-like permease
MIYMLISSACFSLMAFVLKVLYNHSDINTYEVTYWQSIMMAIMNFSLFKAYQKDHMQVPQHLRVTLILRSMAAFFGTTGFYLALQYTDLSKATTLYWTNPMMTAVIAYFTINETLNFIDWLAIFVSFFGIIVIQNPWARTAMAEHEGTEKSVVDTLGSLAAIGGAVFYAVSQMQTRKLGKKVHFLVPPFYQAIFSAFISPLIMFIMLRYRGAATT